MTTPDLSTLLTRARSGDLAAQGDLLRQLRAQHDLTQAALGALLGLAPDSADRTVRRWEAGERRPGGAVWVLIEGLLAPDAAMLRRIAAAREAHPGRRERHPQGGTHA